MRLSTFRQALAATAATAVLAGCSSSTAVNSTSPTSSSTSSGGSSASTAAVTDATTVADAVADNVEVEAGDTAYDESDVVDVSLQGSTATAESDAVSTDAGTVTITTAGTYRLSGDLTGQVVVDSTLDGVVRLVLDDATITSDTTAAIDVVDAQSVVVVLAGGTSNTLADATTYDDTSEEAPTGALYSTADLTIGGTGSLTVTGNANNGIVGKDGLVITGGTVEVTSPDDGIIGKDYLAITGGDVTVDAVDDGLKSDNSTDAGSGFVLIEDGTVTVNSQDDAVKAVQILIAGGTVEVVGSNEALEASVVIIDDGDVQLHAADDGINVASADDSAATDGVGGPPAGGPGGAGMEVDDSLNLVINGGTVEVWSSGDGLDSNGHATITGGDITVYGPTADGNGALDVNGTFEVTGGTLVATGSSGMMVAPSADSAQGWIATALPATAVAGSEVVITDDDGTELATYTVEKDFASVVFSSADVEQGTTYTVSVDGTDTTVTAGDAPAGGHGPMGG